MSVEALKAESGVSKQPVMEALRRLSNEGLVEIITQAGCRIPVYDSADVSGFFAIFDGMERAVADVAASPPSEAEPDRGRRFGGADQVRFVTATRGLCGPISRCPRLCTRQCTPIPPTNRQLMIKKA